MQTFTKIYSSKVSVSTVVNANILAFYGREAVNPESTAVKLAKVSRIAIKTVEVDQIGKSWWKRCKSLLASVEKLVKSVMYNKTSCFI